MKSLFRRNILQHLILIASVMALSACATSNTSGTPPQRTDEATRVVIEKGKFSVPPAKPQPVVMPRSVEPAPSAAQHPGTTFSRVHSKERAVNVRHSPSVRSRVVAVLKGRQSIEVLESNGKWLKIRWQHGNSTKHGWIYRRFVDGFERE